MKVLIVVLLLSIIVDCLLAKPAEELKTDEKSNVDEVLKNKRLLRNYMNCLLDKGKCNPQGQELKKVLPEAIETDCEKCTAKERENAKHVLKFLIENEKEIFSELEKKYDPTGKYRKIYEKEL